MIFTRNAVAAAALLLTASCSEAPRAPQADGWRAALQRGDGALAEVALRRELEGGAVPGDLAPYLGEAALRQNDLVEARRWLAGGGFTGPGRGHGFHMLGRLHVREGDLRAAGQAFDRSLQDMPRSVELWVDIARLRYRGGEQAQAIDASRRALELGPANPAALLLRAQMVRDSQGNLAAVPLFERGLAAAPGDADLLADYAATLGELGRAADMLAAVRRLAAAAPGDRRALYLQAVLAARSGNHDLARRLLQRSGDLDRNVPAAMLLLALVDLENGNPASAAQGFDRLLRRQPDNRRVRLLLAHALAAAGNRRELIARFSDDADSRYLALLVGRAYEGLGERTAAAPYLDRALAGDRGARLTAVPSGTPLDVLTLRRTTDGAGTVALVRALIAARRTGEARNRAEQWRSRHPGSADALGLAGDAAFAARDPATAMARYRAAAAIRRPWPLAKRMAAALEALGEPARAEALVAEHLAGEPNNAEAATMLARRQAARGDERTAAILLAHAAAHGS